MQESHTLSLWPYRPIPSSSYSQPAPEVVLLSQSVSLSHQSLQSLPVSPWVKATAVTGACRAHMNCTLLLPVGHHAHLCSPSISSPSTPPTWPPLRTFTPLSSSGTRPADLRANPPLLPDLYPEVTFSVRPSMTMPTLQYCISCQAPSSTGTLWSPPQLPVSP